MRTISATFRKRSPLFRIVPLLMLAGGAAACVNFDTSRSAPPRGTVGEELYGILCDRVSAQALREDMNGSSFAAICHKQADGTYANDVNMNLLPALDPNAKDVNGQPVPMDKQQSTRAYALARIHAMVRRRDSLVRAFDASFPDIRIPVVDETNGDAKQTCTVIDDATAGDRGKLTEQLREMLGKLQALYNDGTIPHTTEAVAKLMDDINGAEDTRAGLARFEARRGYKPFDVEQGALRPIVAYPQLRDLSNASLRLLSADSDPYSLNATYQNGRRVPVPGPAHLQFSKFLEVTHEELRTFTPDPWAPTPGFKNDGASRAILDRPRTTLEVVDFLMRMTDASFSGGDAPLYLTQRDSRGYAAVPSVAPPFTPDAKNPSLPALDDLGQFITVGNGRAAPSPFPAPNGGAAIARDAAGRALVAAGGAPVYTSVDTSQAFANALIRNLPPLLNPDTKAGHETLMNALAGIEVLSGTRDGAYNTERQYAPDPTRVDDWKLAHPDQDPPPDLATQKVSVKYDMYHRDTAALLDLIWAAGSVVGDPSGDDLLALVQQLVQQKLPDVARLVGTGLTMKAIADKPQYNNAHIPPTSTLWDEVLDTVVKIVQDKTPDNQPGATGQPLLEDMLNALAEDKVDIKNIGPTFANQMKYKDKVTYNYRDSGKLDDSFNGTTLKEEPPKTLVDRTKPDSGENRSLFQRFAQLVADADGVTLCNADRAVVHAQGTLLGSVDLPIPILGATIHECTFQKIDNLSKFFLDSLVHKAQLYVRYNDARDGLLGFISPATVGVFEQSSNIHGFWSSTDPYSSGMAGSGDQQFIPTPHFLTRLQFFKFGGRYPDEVSDNVNSTTRRFIQDLFGPLKSDGTHDIPRTGTALCPERTIPDPCAPGNGNACADPNVKAGDVIHGLRDVDKCNGDWLEQRDGDTLFVVEYDGFADRIKPLLIPLTHRDREDIFIGLMETFNRHWQTNQGTPNECSSDPKNPHYCTRDGASTYEALVADQFVTDLFPMLHDTVQMLKTVTIQRCTAVDATTHRCTASHPVNGIQVLADGARVLLDPNIAANRKVANRDGTVQGLRNDGSKNPQVTPVYLLLQALNKFDGAFAQWTAKHPNDNNRAQLWHSARSQLVDQFLTVNGTGTNSTFANPVTPPALSKILQLFRDQLLAHCPDIFVEKSPDDKNVPMCTWARNDLATKLGDITSGPLFGTSLDVTSAIRQDAAGRSELEKLLLYLTDPKSPNEARKTLLTTLVDFPQLLADDSLTPLIHTLSDGASASLSDDNGNVVRTGVVDAVTALLARLAGRAYTADGVENCGRELDPNQVLTKALQNLVTPMPPKEGDTSPAQTPLEVIIDAIADVNRANPDDSSKLAAPDYANMTLQTSQFLLDKQRGLEQFYEVIREGTVGLPN